MATVADCRRDIECRGISKYYRVCGIYVYDVIDETKHCSKASKYDNMEVAEVEYKYGEYFLWIRV